MISPPKIEPKALIKPKKALVAIGRMGHGKSAFVKMLACPQEKPNIHARTDIQSVTGVISFYKVDPALRLYSQDLYVIDTPGLDSDEAVFVILEHLYEFIIRESFEIVALVYVLNINAGRQSNDKGKNCIFTFYEHLKLRHSIKKEIMTCLLSHFDQYHIKKEGNQRLFLQFEKKFTQYGIPEIWKRKIQWMSQPEEDRNQYKQIVNNQSNKGHKIWINQWIQLKGHLKQNKLLTFYQFKKDLQIFNTKLIKQLENVLDSNSGIKTELIFRELIIEKLSYWRALSQSVKDSIKGFILGPAIFHLFSKNLKECSDSWEQQHHQILCKQLIELQMQELQKCTKITNDDIIISNSKWIESINGTIIHQQNGEKQLNFVKQNQTKIASIWSGIMKLTYRVRRPTIQAYEKFSQKLTKQFYEKL